MRYRRSRPKELLFDPSCPKPRQSNRDGSVSRHQPTALQSTSRFRHRIRSFIWAKVAKGVFTTQDWSVFSARILAHKFAAGIGRAFFSERRQIFLQEPLSRGLPKEGNNPCDPYFPWLYSVFSSPLLRLNQRKRPPGSTIRATASRMMRLMTPIKQRSRKSRN